MKIKLDILSVAVSIGCVTVAQAQEPIKPKNNFGLYGGFTQLDIKTNNFITKGGQGWIGGFTADVATK